MSTARTTDDTRTSTGVQGRDATGPFTIDLRLIHDRPCVRMVRNPRFPLNAFLTEAECRHMQALYGEAADALALMRKSEAA